MSDYTVLDNHVWGSGDDCLRVKVFGADSVSRDNLDTAYYGVETAVSDVYYDDYNAPNIDYAEVTQYDTNIDFSCSPSDDRNQRQANMRSQFNDWLDDHSFNEQGCCLLVTDCGVAVGWENAWTGRTVALVSTDWYGDPWDPDEYMRAMAAHESLHTFVNDDCDDVEALIDDPDNEHQLGTINVFDEVTALAASYEDSGKYHQDGDCSGYNPDDDAYTAQASNCTAEALSASLEHANSWWHDNPF